MDVCVEWVFFLTGKSCSRGAETHSSLSGWSIRARQNPQCSCTAESLFLHRYVQKPVAPGVFEGEQIGLHGLMYVDVSVFIVMRSEHMND